MQAAFDIDMDGLLESLSSNSRHILVVGGIGHKELPFWEKVSAELQTSDTVLVFLCYSAWPTLPKASFPIIDLHQFGYSVRPAHPEHAGTDDANHVRAMWHLSKSLLNIRTVLLWNGLHGMWLAWKKQLESDGMPHLIVERGAFPGTIQIEPHGLNGLSVYLSHNAEIPESGHDGEALLRAMRNHLLQNKKSHNAQPSEFSPERIRKHFNLAPSDKVIVYFGAWDEAAGISEHEGREVQSPHFASSRNALERIIAATPVNSNVTILYKQHTADSASWENLADGIRIYSANQIGAHGLIELADVVAGLQSSLLYIAAMLDKPVLLLGRTALSDKGYAYEVSGSNDLPSVMADALSRKSWQGRLAARDKFMHHYLTTHCYTQDEQLLDMGVQPAKAALGIITRHLSAAEPESISRETYAIWAYTVLLWSKVGRALAPQKLVSNALLRHAAHAARSPLGKALSTMSLLPGFRAVGRFFKEIRQSTNKI
jgi:hypothetical protein